MPRFYIHFRNGNIVAKDDVGQNFPDFAEAKAAALISAREILADDVRSNTDKPLEAVTITDEDGQELITIAARDILPERLQ